MLSLVDYIKIYPNVLSDDVCDSFIRYFEESTDKFNFKNPIMDFTQMGLENHSSIKKEYNHLNDLINETYLRYRKDVIGKFPSDTIIEPPRLKKYEPNTGIFDWHTDAHGGPKTQGRTLILLWYLNTVREGGETEFRIGDDILSLKPNKGTVLCFPPFFMYPHRGTIPISEPKYVISSYINYISK